ncbi:MAG: hypothetical protein MJ158_01345 [Alphaproteobacteria bacterium]|nr:hypothetical protein [Alphaproteobacteria bacterium]
MNFSKKYHILKRMLANPKMTARQQMDAWHYRDALMSKTIDEKAFTKYAKRLFNTSFKIITTSPVLSEYVLRFNDISNEEKRDFGQRFLNILTAQHNLSSVHLNLIDNQDDLGGDEARYAPSLNLIGVWKGSYTLNSINSFMCVLLHEFTHHIYEHNPKFGPISTSKIKAVVEQGYIGWTDNHKEPIEAPALFVEEYLNKHDFTYALISKIKQKTV